MAQDRIIMTLGQVISLQVGEEATPEYLESLGYNEDTLNTAVTQVFTSEDVDIYDIGAGYHVSGLTFEVYSEDPIGDGYVTQEELDSFEFQPGQMPECPPADDPFWHQIATDEA